MRFNVGDQVRVVGVRPPDPPPSCPVDWASGMDEYLGRQGTVSSVDEFRGVACFTVTFPDDESWGYLAEWLGPVLDVGDEVAWKVPGGVPTDKPSRGRVLGVGVDKIAVWPGWYAACEPLFIKREWLVADATSQTESEPCEAS